MEVCMLKLVTQLKEATQLKWNRVDRFKPLIKVEVELGAYIVKTADSVEELLKIFRLRHDVFNREFREINKSGLDVDKFDRAFDHLIIFHKPSQQIVGTYRLRPSYRVHTAYTAQEFELSGLYAAQGPYLELGRACVHKEHRKGVVMSLLFRGIAEYMNSSGARILYGCSSVKVKEARQAALIYKYLLEENAVTDSFGIAPTSAFTMPRMDAWLKEFSGSLSEALRSEARGYLPSLVSMYLKMGAKVASLPAYDRDFACIDLLTVLNRENLTEVLAQKYGVMPRA